MKSEIESLYKIKTWTLVARPQNKNMVSTKWFFKIKKGGDGEVIKYNALVAWGFSILLLLLYIFSIGIDYTDSFSSGQAHYIQVFVSFGCSKKLASIPVVCENSFSTWSCGWRNICWTIWYVSFIKHYII